MPNDLPTSLPAHEGVLTAGESPASTVQARKALLENVGRLANQPYQKYDIVDMDGQLRRVYETRLAKKHKHHKDAEELLTQHANPFDRSRETQLEKETRRRREQGMADALELPSRKPIHEQHEREASLHGSHHAGRYRQGIKADLEELLSDVRDKELKKQKISIQNNPMFNRPGSRFSGQKQAALEKAERKSSKNYQKMLAKAELSLLKDSYNAGLQEKGLATQAFARNEAQDYANRQERRQAIMASQDLAHRDRADKLQHIGLLHQLGTAEEARDQQAKDILHGEYEEQRKHPFNMAEWYSNILHGHPGAAMYHSMNQGTGSPYFGIQQALGNSMLGVGSQMFNRTMGGAYEHHADGGIIGQALFNGVANHTSPYQALRDLSRQQLMTGLIQNQANKRQQYATGGAVSPIMMGAQQAAEFAQIKKNKLDEANRMRQMQQQPIGHSIFEGITSGLSHTPGWGHQGAIMGEAVKGRHARQAAHEASREKASKLETEALKHEMEMHKANHQMLMDERRVKADERRARLEERRFQYDTDKLELEKEKLKGKLESLSPQDQKSETDLNNKIEALTEAYGELLTMEEILPDVYTGYSAKLPSVAIDYFGGTKGKQGLFEKAQESAVQNRARAKFGNNRIPVAELESARKSSPNLGMGRAAAQMTIEQQKKDYKRKLDSLLKQKKTPFPGDLSMWEDRSEKSSPSNKERSQSSSIEQMAKLPINQITEMVKTGKLTKDDLIAIRNYQAAH